MGSSSMYRWDLETFPLEEEYSRGGSRSKKTKERAWETIRKIRKVKKEKEWK